MLSNGYPQKFPKDHKKVTSKHFPSNGYLVFCDLMDLDDSFSKNMLEQVPPNPWDHLFYKLYKRIGWEMYRKERKIVAPQTIVTFDDSFIRWRENTAVSKEMLKIAEEKLKEYFIN